MEMIENLKVLLNEINKFLPQDKNCKITLCVDKKENIECENFFSLCSNTQDTDEIFLIYVVYLKEENNVSTKYDENNILFIDVDVINRKCKKTLTLTEIIDKFKKFLKLDKQKQQEESDIKNYFYEILEKNYERYNFYSKPICIDFYLIKKRSTEELIDLIEKVQAILYNKEKLYLGDRISQFKIKILTFFKTNIKLIFSFISMLLVIYLLLLLNNLGIPISIYNIMLLQNIILTVSIPILLIILIVLFIYIITSIIAYIVLYFIFTFIKNSFIKVLSFVLCNKFFCIFKFEIEKIEFKIKKNFPSSKTIINGIEVFIHILIMAIVIFSIEFLFEPIEIILYEVGAPRGILVALENFKFNSAPYFLERFRDYTTYPQVRKFKEGNKEKELIILSIDNTLIYYYNIDEILELYKPLYSILEKELERNVERDETLESFCYGIVNFYNKNDIDNLVFHMLFITPSYIWIKECYINTDNENFCNINNIFPLKGKISKIINIDESKKYIKNLQGIEKLEELDNNLQDTIKSFYERCQIFIKSQNKN